MTTDNYYYGVLFKQLSIAFENNLQTLETDMTQDLSAEEEEIFHDMLMRVLQRICPCSKEKKE